MSDVSTQDPAASAEAAGLRYVTDDEPGYRRKKWGKGFTFETPDGGRLTKKGKDKEVRERIDALAIPPAYTDVWICASPDGHIQATGRDDRGRKQYIYHPKWREARERAKYDRMISFGETLPRIRKRVEQDMAQPGLSKDKVLAAVVELLETTLIRVGNAEYAEENASYGLTTIRKKHAEVSGQTVTFDFTGKSHKEWHVELKNKRLAKIVKECLETPGYELFKYIDEAGERHDVGADDVNDYLKRITERDFTAKDFRTWAGTVLTAVALQEMETGSETSETQAKKNVVAAIKRVAERLGNTPAVCRQSYVHPDVIDAYMEGSLAEVLKGDVSGALENAAGLNPEEASVWAFLQERLEKIK